MVGTASAVAVRGGLLPAPFPQRPLELSVVHVQFVNDDIVGEGLTHPRVVLDITGMRRGEDSLELVCDLVQVEREVLGDKSTDFGILAVSGHGEGVAGRRGVDVHVEGWKGNVSLSIYSMKYRG